MYLFLIAYSLHIMAGECTGNTGQQYHQKRTCISNDKLEQTLYNKPKFIKNYLITGNTSFFQTRNTEMVFNIS
jgi:hypothetical protein